MWANENPRNICETNDRNEVKVMIFVAIINGFIPIIHAFLDDDSINFIVLILLNTLLRSF